ncbi:MAG: hypothetical protein JWN03_3096 [Nocardia sp.]|uniref:hypothetical protein n=1 Tax=Nocardia sp. TaxID=1821 RepID=UPI0026065A62|nr:hypothetical protein [Nocardia sp.]MCU1642821.1 hypothetical protein [Nocardia sp.]
MDLTAILLIVSSAATGVAASAAAAAARVIITKNKIRLTREVLRDVPGADRPAVLQALAEIL